MTREEFIEQLKNSGLSQVEKIARLAEFDKQQKPSTPDLGLGKPTDPANVKEANVGSEGTASSSDFGLLGSPNKPIFDTPVFDDFDASDEINTIDERVKAGFIRIGAKFNKIPAAVNQLRYMLAKPFMSDEQKERLASLTPQQEYIVTQAIFGAAGAPGANLGAGSLEKLKRADELNKKADELEKDFANYENSIGEAFAEGDIAEGATRLLSNGIGALPSVVQAITPYVGLPSIFAGEFADASDRYVREEGGRAGEVKGAVYSAARASSETLLELTTRRLGKGLFKSLSGKPKSFITKTLRQHLTGVAKEFGKEGASELGTEFFNRLADQVILGKEDSFNNFYRDGIDVFLIGGVVGGKLKGTTSGFEIARATAINRSVNKTLQDT